MKSVYNNKSPFSYSVFFLLGTTAAVAITSSGLIKLHQDSFISNLRLATIAVMILFVTLAILYLPDGMIGRPTQKLWKGVTGFSMFYTMILLYFVYLSPQQTQKVLSTFFDSSLGRPLPEKSYASDCRLYIPGDADPFKNLKDSTFDIFFIAHFVGWFFKTLICRDLKLVLFQSVFFELLEVALRHLLPNFWECWWDHVILDVMAANLLGIILGWFVIKRYNLYRLKWSLREGPLKRTFIQNFVQFWSNSDVSNVEFKMFTSLPKFFSVMWFVAFMPLADLTFFFTKFMLNIPPPHYLNGIRIWMMGLICINSSREYYAFITKREPEMRINTLISQTIVFLEIILIFKNYNGQFDNIQAPWEALLIAGVFGGMFLLTLAKIIYSDIYRICKKHIFTESIKAQ